MSTAPTTATFDMQEAAKATGLTASVIRVWEARYGWPCPKRQRNGYRSFTQFDIDQIKRVANLVRSGVPISQIIVDGLPQFPSEPVNHPPQPVTLVRAVPKPTTQAGFQARQRVEEACARNDSVALRLEVAQAVRLRPNDREAAVYAPVIAFLVETDANHIEVFARNELTAELTTAIGGVTVAATVEAVMRSHLETLRTAHAGV